MRKIHTLLLLGSIFFVSATSGQTALYADAGTGTMRNYISWFNWDGFTVANGASKTFTTSDGLSVTISFSGVSASPVVPYVMNTWSGAVLWKLYDFTNPAIKPALFSNMTLNAVSFQISVTATRDGVPAPFTFIAADAEASDATEVMTLSTNGTAWRTIEFYRNSGQTNNPVGGCGTQTVTVTQTYGGATATGQNPILATDASGSLVINTNFNRTMQGNMAVAFGIFSPIDRGDLPSPYPVAHHALAFTTSNSCNFNPPYPSITQTNHVYLGTQPGDADGAQTTNDNASGADEDGVTVFPAYTGNGTYTLNLAVRNTSPVAAVATLKGWFDYNRDGNFSAGESAAVFIPGAATTATLTWSGLPSTLPSGSQMDFAFRFRISFNGSQIFNPSGYASDGEVEDYLIQNAVVAPAIPANASFTAPDTVCVGQSFTITNNSTNADTHLWNFCQQPFSTTPTGINLGNPGNFGIPVYMDYYFENGNYYALLINNTPGGLVRLNFGNSLLNTPTSTLLGNFGGALPNAAQGIQIVKNGSEILAIIVGGDPVFGTASRILKLSFGTSITNPAPVMTNWGNPNGLLNYPHDIHIFKDGSNWYGFTTNIWGNSITRFNFGSDFSTTPAGTNFSPSGLDGPTGFTPVIQNGNHYLFIANWSGSSIARVDFGNSFLNGPVGSVNFGNLGALSSTRDIQMFTECGEITGYALNGSSSLVKLNFTSVTSIPTAVNLGNIGGLNGPHSFSRTFRSGSNVYSFVPNNANNTFSRLAFSGSCATVSTQTSTLGNPPAISYSTPGTYNISLIVNDGAVTQSSFCKQVVAMPQLTHSPTQTISSCGPVRIGSSIKPATYLWNTGATTDSINVTTPGTYWVESTRYGCTVRDSFVVAVASAPVDFGFQQNVCSPKTVQFSTTLSNYNSFEWDFGNSQTNTSSLTPSVTYAAYGTYQVKLKVTRTGGCVDSTTKSISINAIQANSLISNSDTTICAGSSVTIRQTATGVTNCFQFPSGNVSLNRDTTVTPATTTTYHYTVLTNASNLVTNGDFSQGNTGFSTQYNFATNNTTEGEFNVAVNPQTWNGSLSGCRDHTTGSGNMMMVNGSPEPGRIVWSQTVAVTPNTTYSFSTWIQSLFPVNPANLRFSINSTVIGNNIIASSTTCNWQRFFTTWNSGNSTTAVISIVNNNTIVMGNDFAIDDIYFGGTVMQTDSVKITVLPKPTMTIFNNDSTICSGTSVSLNSASSGTSITWTPATSLSDPNIANPVATPSNTVKYYAEANAGSGCSTKDSVTITVLRMPTAVSIADTAICVGSSIVLQTAITDATSIQWTPAATLSNPAIANPTATPASFTEYIVTATNGGICTAKDSVKVNVKPVPTVTVTDDTTVCGTANIQLVATGGTSYSWSPGTGLSSTTAANPVAQPTSTTKYKVTVTGANGCQKQDSVTITVNPLPVFNITPATQAVCAGSPVTITASGGDIYSWTPAPGITNPAQPAITLTPTASGNYTVNVIHSACKVSQTLSASVQVNPIPNVTVTKSGDVTCSQPQSQLNATGGATYQWTPAVGLSNPNIPNPVASPTTNTVYTVKVGTAQGCFAEKTITVNFLGGSGAALYIPNAFSPNNDGLNDEFKVFFPGVQKFNLKIFNGWGEMVFETKDITKGWNGFYKGRKQGTDVFVYVMTAEGVCGGSIFRKGSIMLIR